MLNKLPTNWDLKKVDDVANIYLGLTYTPTYTESGVPFLSVKDLNDTYLDFEKSKFISYEEYKNATENAKPKKGDIIFGRVGTLGNPLIIETDIEFCIFVSLGFFRIKDNSCEPNFLASWMKSPLFHKQVDNIVAGGAQKNLNTGWLKNFLIPIPPLPEQKAIAQVLITADAAIHTTEKLIAQKELRKKWLMQQLLTGKKRLKGFEGEWKKERLEKYLVKHDEKSTENNQYPVLTSSRRGIFLQSDYYTRDVASEDNTGYNVVPRGYFTYRHMSDDLIFKFNINDIVDRGIVSTLYPVFTTKDINSYFLLVKLNDGSEFKMHAEEQKQGGSRTYVYFKTLCQLKLNLPSIEEQTAIAQVLQAADNEISLLKAKAEKLREQKKGLMQVLLTGKVRLKIN
jgi:type I restriction enzyme S subunit